MKAKIALVSLCILFASAALAGPAAWYEWRNTTTKAIVCSQTSPGNGWVKYSGPYTDMKCTTRGQMKK